jgi:hypothetical protein
MRREWEAIKVSKEWPTLDENIQFIIKDLGTEKILRHMTLEERLEGLSQDELRRLRRLLDGDSPSKPQR